MQYGHFNDEAREYVIDTPATPLPWINYLGNEDFFGLVSNTGGGYDFYRDAKLRRITRYRYNGVPADNGSRSYYLSTIGEDGKPTATWSPTFLPARTELDSYRCRHGIGYTVFEASRAGISSTLTAFVPLHTHAEVNRLELSNGSGAPVTLDVTGAVEWCLWNAADDAENFQRNFSTGEVEVERTPDASVLYHKTEFKERRNHYAFYAVNHGTLGFDTDRASFLGQFNGWESPDAVAEARSRNSVAHGWSPIAANHIRLHLEAGETTCLIFTLGYVEVDPHDKWEVINGVTQYGVINKAPAHAILQKLQTESQIDTAFQELRDYWNKLLSRFTVKSGDSKLDRMVNIWNQYQCMVTFNLSRSASYFESGVGRGMGFRDSNQDLLGFVHLIPDRARERLLDLASTQLPDGSACHQYQPLTKKGNADIGGGFNDDPLWLVAAVHAYLAETGDSTILSELVPFNSTKGTEVTMLEHLRRSVYYTMHNLGPHKLPLIGHADWNDCLNLNAFSSEPGVSFQTATSNMDGRVAESVFIAGMFVLYANRFVDILKKFGSRAGVPSDEAHAQINEVKDAIATVKEATETAGWDGEWFRRAYDAYSRPVGSRLNDEGKIFIEPQGMCVMAGIGIENGHAKKALDSVKMHLTSEWGSAIIAPTFSRYHIELGEISTFIQGYKENGGIFCHNNPWISIANVIVGNDDEAFNVYRRTAPAYVEDRSDVRKTEPYVYCQMVSGPEAAVTGEGKNSWLTGTAAWSFVNVSQYLLGIRPTLEGLEIDPHLPSRFTKVTISRLFRGKWYDITLTHTGTKTLTVDGKKIEGDLIPAPLGSSEGTHTKVEATF
ncbi:MAG: glycosyl transferase [Bifidobacteriaceae bacterium]|jgi:cellobiose phosphorylase|nr:glycosyl transferase [Bifidobacteriaceae bacterium]